MLEAEEDKSFGIAHTQAAIITWVFARRTCTIEMHLANTTDIVVWDVPSPCRDRVPLADFDLHC
jgi:hypothetical protein